MQQSTPQETIKRRRLKRLLQQRLVIYGLAFGMVGGVVALVVSQAATSTASIIAGDGAISGSAQLITDASAASGKAVKFGSSQISLPTSGSWTNVTGNLANMQSECGNLTSLFPVPNSDTVIAGVALKGLWSNSAGTTTWSHMGSGSGSAVITNRPNVISYDPINPSIFYEAGIYSGGGAFKTTNGGATFTQLGNISHTDYMSVDFSDPIRQTMVAGGHEQFQTVYKSIDGGQNWTNIGQNLPSGTGFSSSPIVINSQTFLVNTNASWAGGTPGIYRTTNGGNSWQKVTSVNVIGSPLVTSTGDIYWQVGTFNSDHLLRSTDHGVTWNEVGSGLISVNPLELPDGRLVSSSNTRLVVSADNGSTWTPFGSNLPFTPAGVIYSQNRQRFLIWQWDCGNVVLPNAIMQLQ